MRYLILFLMAASLSACAAKRIVAKDCKLIGSFYYDCEEAK